MFRAYKYHPSIKNYRHALHGPGASSTISFTTFDQDYNPTNRTISGGISNRTYDTDDVGNITQTGTYTYGYDSLNRMNAENVGSATTYTFDATSNRLTKVQGGTTTSTVPSTSNKISAVGGSNITYDSSGNFTAFGGTAYSWNAAGQLSFTSTGGSTVGTYTYNASNQRTKKVAGGNTVQYVYGLNGLLYGEYDNSGTMIREYVYQNDEALAQVDAGSPEVLTYLHPNHLGTPQYGTNTGGSQVWFISADSYGVGTPSGSRTVNLRMPGQYYDSESGLFYNWNRYYSPALGRYISSDPIGLEGGLNTFNYASVSPLMFIDPDGLKVIPGGSSVKPKPLLPPTVDCPPTLAGCIGSADLTPYSGNPEWFHCGGTGFVQSNTPKGHKQQECFYDRSGNPITNNCRGTPNNFDAKGNPTGHILNDMLTLEALKALIQSQTNYPRSVP